MNKRSNSNTNGASGSSVNTYRVVESIEKLPKEVCISIYVLCI